MPIFGQKSKENLETCHPLLQKVFNEVIKNYDCSILEGRRDKETQDKYYKTGRSNAQWPNSKHNETAPNYSLAVDVAPYPIDFPDRNKLVEALTLSTNNFYHELVKYNKALGTFYVFGMYVLNVAKNLGIELVWGGDWDGDLNIKDQNLDDLPHFELKNT